MKSNLDEVIGRRGNPSDDIVYIHDRVLLADGSIEESKNSWINRWGKPTNENLSKVVLGYERSNPGTTVLEAEVRKQSGDVIAHYGRRRKYNPADREPNPRDRAPVDETAATELRLFADNESTIYKQKLSIIENLKKKKRAGTYDPALAPKLWLYFVDAAAKQYAKEFGNGESEWSTIFNKPTREHVAREIAYDEGERIDAGEYEPRAPRGVLGTLPRTMYGFEALTDEGWTMEGAGEQNESNYFATRAEAEAELPRLARVLETDLAHVRVVEVPPGHRSRRGNPAGWQHRLEVGDRVFYDRRPARVIMTGISGEYGPNVRIRIDGDGGATVETSPGLDHRLTLYEDDPTPPTLSDLMYGSRRGNPAGQINDRRRDPSHQPRGFVVMRDKFMSGWGQTVNGKSYYAIAVDTEDEGYTVIANAADRSEMKNVHWSRTLPRIGKNDHLSVTDKHEAPRWFEKDAWKDEE